jgi:uncharacterized protein YukE
VTGFGVDHQKLSETAGQTSSKAKDAEGIQQKVSSADGLVPPQAWGLLGKMTVHNAYTSMLGTFQDHLSNMAQGIQKLADDIKATADQYRQNDEDAQEKLKDIEKELDDSSGAGEAG